MARSATPSISCAKRRKMRSRRFGTQHGKRVKTGNGLEGKTKTERAILDRIESELATHVAYQMTFIDINPERYREYVASANALKICEVIVKEEFAKEKGK